MLYSNILIHAVEALIVSLVFLTIFRVAKQTSQFNQGLKLDALQHDNEIIKVVRPSVRSDDVQHQSIKETQKTKTQSQHNTALNDYIGDFF